MMMSNALQIVRIASLNVSRRAGSKALSGLSWIVFAGLDITDQLLCPVFAVLDYFLDSEKRACYCQSGGAEQQSSVSKDDHCQGPTCTHSHCPGESWARISVSLYSRVRRSGRTRFHLLSLHRTLSRDSSDWAPHKGTILEEIPHAEEIISTAILEGGGQDDLDQRNSSSHLGRLTKRSVKRIVGGSRTVKPVARWSDCGCPRCTAWQSDLDQLLYVNVDDKDFVASPGKELKADNVAAENNVIFVHGFLSSSSFWADTVLPALPKSVRASHRLFAVDALGFGRSPKPASCLYTLADHIDLIQRSVIEPYGIKSFHLVAHSMGCTIALAFAARYPSTVKSITLIAPPYVPDVSGDSSSTYIMQQIAARSIWPLVSFGSSVMSWYEHIGRVVCFTVCKHHRLWEPLLLFAHSMLPGKKVPVSCVTDFTWHTHHSAWHIFHNTICSGAYSADHYLEVLEKAGTRVRVIHGTRDVVISFKNSVSLCERHPNVRLTVIPSADHGTVVFGREAELAKELAEEILSKPMERILSEPMERRGGQNLYK